ncbi:RNA polymerase sigma factor [Longimycelium tulufanense]|uniref:RNA polymerase sigma factor n=1 Tax=Longimycelium tulufanense TaxID=907463 RepID=A0A8J3FVE5_9PSEU|nr:sigma-70 family RNA polymerase sigma factor [Longimycelium tulufanense]GGM43670.1 RNA polymerase sigma factor [Longimycelium tulufanense]
MSLSTTDDPPWEGLDGPARHAVCLDAARNGNRDALHVLVDELTPLVWHVVRGQGVERPAAEDVVQTVWLALLRNLDRLDQPRALAAWLITTARREAVRVRSAERSPTSPLPTEVLDQVPTTDGQPEAEALRGDRDRRLWSAFRRLPPRCQELLRLTVVAGRARYQAVAEALGMPRGSIGPTRGRCLETLRALLGAEGGTR